MILLFALLFGLALRALCGGSLAGLSETRLHGEIVFMVLLLFQVIAPSAGSSEGAHVVMRYIWLGSLPVVLFVACLNWRQPGLVLLALGLALNLGVVYANGGMPVATSAVQFVHPGIAAVIIPPQDFVHLALGSGTRLPWLADVLPLPGPTWLRSVASAGDCILAAGIAIFIARAGASPQKCLATKN